MPLLANVQTAWSFGMYMRNLALDYRSWYFVTFSFQISRNFTRRHYNALTCHEKLRIGMETLCKKLCTGIAADQRMTMPLLRLIKCTCLCQLNIINS